MTGNRQYDEMYAAAAARLQARGLEHAAGMAGADLTSQGMWIDTLGTRVCLDPETLMPKPPLDMWHHLSLLQYLAAADGAAPSGDWIGLGELSDGRVSRGMSFDREIGAMIEGRLGRHAPDDICAACARLGATFVGETRADLCAVFRFAPACPLRLNLWYQDDEFPASGKLLVDPHAARLLGVETIGTIGVLLIQMLCRQGGQPAGVQT